jgi:regulator of sirC expression with transglutaminase-like and TPR domain
MQAWTNRVVILTKMQRWNEVVADCNHILELDDSNIACYNSRGVAYHMLGDNIKAEKDLTIVVEKENQSMVSKVMPLLLI